MTDETTNTAVTVLVVDDDSDTRSVVASAISMLGFMPIEAESGKQALELCHEFIPHLVVLDIMMPGMDGNEVCRAIRIMEGGDIVPIIMLTARDRVKDKVEALGGGADDYLTKPFHYQELQARVNALLRVRELNISLQEKNQELERIQQKLIEQEKKAVIGQLAGTAAHQLGQPLTAISLNTYLLETLDTKDKRYKNALSAIKQDVARMVDLIEKLKSADPGKTESYFEDTEILDIGEK
ncbi:response regulator [Oligoflexia bacterium]|nr:response regulator [Oligoflexia bacterium]